MISMILPKYEGVTSRISSRLRSRSLRQCEEREERSARRQEGALSAEFDEKLKEMNASPGRILMVMQPV